MLVYFTTIFKNLKNFRSESALPSQVTQVLVTQTLLSVKAQIVNTPGFVSQAVSVKNTQLHYRNTKAEGDT